MLQTTFLFSLALIWILFAVVQDLRKREIANWLNFSLIAFALGFRFFYSLFSQTGFNFFLQGLIGLGIFFVLGNVFYYGRVFAGGDAKLLIALGPVLPLFTTFTTNIKFLGTFLVFFLVAGAVYSIIASLTLSLRNYKRFKKEFSKQFKAHYRISILFLALAIVFLVLGLLIDSLLVYLGIVSFLTPYLYIYAKAVDESCMIKSIKTSMLTEGDWLYKDVKINRGRTIKASWDGLTKSQIQQLKKKHKSVLIRQGIPFSPAFLISFILLICLLTNGLWNFLF